MVTQFKSLGKDGTENLVPSLPPEAKLDSTLGKGAGKWVDTYVDYADDVSPMTPGTFHESAALWLASVAIARRLVLRMPHGDVYPNLYILWVAQTTLYRKSTALNVALGLARKAYPFLLAPEEFTPEALFNDFAGKDPTGLDSLPSSERAEWLMSKNYAAQKGWGLDELSSLLVGAGKDYNAGLIEALLRFYDCDPRYTRSTKGQGRITVRNAYLSLLGASTPMALSSHLLSKQLWSNGWWPRFAILTPETERPIWREACAKEEPIALVAHLESLYKRLPESTFANYPVPISVNLGINVFEAWKGYNKALSYDLITPDLDERLCGIYGRLPVQALKVAMILAALDWSDDSTPRIELPHLARAIGITESWRESAHRVLRMATTSDFDELCKLILNNLSKKNGEWSTSRDLYRSMTNRKSFEVNQALDELLEQGYIEFEVCSSGPKGGRPARRYRLITE